MMLLKQVKILGLCLVMFGAALVPAVQSAPDNSAFNTFWQKFKSAVIHGQKDSVATMTRFPLTLSYGKRSIKSGAELRRRYREVFSEQTNAVKCFEKKEPEKDPSNAHQFIVACPDQGGNEVVIYHFQSTKTGWKFVGLDNINE